MDAMAAMAVRESVQYHGDQLIKIMAFLVSFWWRLANEKSWADAKQSFIEKN